MAYTLNQKGQEDTLRSRLQSAEKRLANAAPSAHCGLRISPEAGDADNHS